MADATDEVHSGTRDTTKDFLRSFSVVEYDSEDEFDELSPIPETPADGIDSGVDSRDGPDLTERVIPFKTIFNPAGPYTSTKTNFWIPGQPVNVKIVDYERQEIKVINPNLYRIEVTHGEYQWTVLRRYKHFRQLHDALAFFRAKVKMPLPRSEGGRERKKTLKKEWQRQVSVRFPLRLEALIREENIKQRMEQLEKYLQNLLLCKSYRNHPETLKFFEVSHLSFVSRLGPKGKEGFVKKCSGGRRISIGCCGCLQKVHFAGTWNQRWLVLKDTYLAYVRPEDGVISDVMLMDSVFKVECGMKSTGAKHGVLISNLQRNLLVKCWTSRKAREWADHIEKTAQTHAAEFTQPKRFESFAPPRDDSYARWFVDARSYFEAVAEALEKAKEEIYITDWWLSPEIYLKRPMVDGDQWRLDVILARKAEQGVRVYILLYKEIEAALMIKSIYSKQILMSKHENIKVLRHPDHIPGKGILLWAHHEKLVAIDQQIAFIGGIDLCYGRWDDAQHRLIDLGSIVLNHPPSPMPLSVASSRPEESFVTDTTDLTDELRSIDSPASLRGHPPATSRYRLSPTAAAKAAPRLAGSRSDAAAPSDVDITVVPPSPPATTASNNASKFSGLPPSESAVDDFKAPEGSPARTEDIIVKEDAAKQHVFAKVLLDSRGDESASETDVDVVSQSENFTGRSKHVSPSSEMFTGSSNTESEGESPAVNGPKTQPQSESSIEGSVPHKEVGVNDTKSQSVDSTTSASGGKKHLWGDRKLKLKIPHRSNEHARYGATNERTDSTSDPRRGDRKMDEVDKLETAKQSDLCCAEESQRLRTSSDTSQGSKNSASALITHDENTNQQQQQPPDSAVSGRSSGSVRDSIDFKGAVSALNVFRRMGRGKHEENNNKDQSHRHSGDDPKTPGADGEGDTSSLARRRWKMVFNVQKFESVVRHAQTPERIPESLLSPAITPGLGKDKKRGQSFYRFRRENRGSFDLGKKEIGKADLLQPGVGGVYRTHSEQDILECGLQGSTKLWIGKDYVNFIQKDFVNLEQPFEDFIDRTQYPRMPWHDIGAMVYGTAARDVARHFIQRWNFTKTIKYKRSTTFPMLLPKAYPKLTVPQSIRDITFNVKTQVLRSLCGWSAGIEGAEKSIHEAYEFCIENAKHYIYIENQFFITQVEDTSQVSNRIGTALHRRILRAYRSGEDFKVYVVMPLLPAFEGEFGTASGVALQAVTHWNYASICRGGNSLIEKLHTEVPDPHKYIVFCGLRTWERLDKKLVTELIYVHSKLMIVDDNTVIIGSANINDRSMMGKRDSELAVLFQDTEKERIDLNGRTLEPGPFASSLRHTIFREHLGLSENNTEVDLRDIVCDSFYKDVWIKRAAINSSTYDKVFRCIPTDNVHNFQALKQYNAEPPMATTKPDEALQHLSKIRGHLVLMPLQFLRDEVLTPKVGQKEALLPSYLWT